MKACAFSLLAFLFLSPAWATTYYWTGAAGDGNKWSTKANWKTDAADPATKLPGSADVAYFDVAEPTTIDVATSRTSTYQFVIASTSAALTFGGSGSLEFFCKAYTNPTVAGSSDVIICCSNVTSCVTTFNCPVIFRYSSGIAFGPGCIFNSSANVQNPSVWFCKLDGVTPCAAAAKTVFNEGWTGTPQSIYLYSGENAVVLDSASGSSSSYGKYWYFPADSDGKLTIKGGSVQIGGTFFYQSTYPVEINFEGGTFAFYTENNDLFKYFRRTGGDLITCHANSFIPGSGLETDGILAPAGTKTWITRDRLHLFDRKDDTYSVGTYYLNAPIYMTNTSETVRFNPDWLYSYPLLTGPGEIRADYMEAYGASVINTTLCVGKQFKCSSDGGTFVFSNATIRMYGDLPDYATKTQRFNLYATNTFDTANCHGLAKAHAAEFMTCYYDDPKTVVNVIGGGLVQLRQYQDTNHRTGNMVAGELNVAAGTIVSLPDSLTATLDKVTLGANAKLLLSNGVLRVKTLVAGDGSEIHAKFTTDKQGSLFTEQLTQEGSFTLAIVGLPSGTTDAAYVAAYSSLDEAQTTVTIQDLSGRSYQSHFSNGSVFLGPSSVTPTKDPEWTGAKDGYWSEAENWTSLPTAGDQLFAGGFVRLAATNDFPAKTEFGSITFQETAGPFVIGGNELVLTNGVSGSYAPRTIVSNSRAGQTFDCDVTFAHASATLESNNSVDGITFNGKVRTTDGVYYDALKISGAVRFGGDAVIHKICFPYASTLRVLAGGRVTVTNQEAASALDLDLCSFTIDAGGVFVWAETNPKPFYWTSSNTHTVNGQMIIGANYGAGDGKVQTFTGTGRLDITKGYNYLMNQTLPICGGLHLNNKGDFPTANADGSDSCAAIALTNATLGALADWTYGPSSAVTDSSSLLTTPARRALKLSGACTIDTEDPDTDVAHTITFTDPIDGAAGALVKTGAGDVILAAETASVTNNFAGGLTLSEGRVVLAGPNTNTVAGAVVFAGGGLGLKPTLLSQCKDWTTVLVAASISGDPIDPKGKAMLRTVETANGVAIQAKKNKQGIILILQ